MSARGKIHAAFIGSKIGFCGEDVIPPTLQTQICTLVGNQYCKRCVRIIANEIAKTQRREA